MLRARSERAIDDGGTGLIVFSMEGELLSLNPHAERWMSELPGTMTDEHPVAVVTILAHALAVDQGHQRGNARLRVLSKSGDWLVLSASPMFGADGVATSIVVVIEPANTSEIMPLLADAYGLSMREQQVTQSLAQGLATGAIARSLHLSEHTVRDHVKAILGKVGVSSRGELIAALFFGHVKERLGSH